MLILTIRTDKPEAEIGLYEDDNRLQYEQWTAHRQLAETLHRKIIDLLTAQDKSLKDLDGVIVFEGPGSFTGLRIGLSVGNALAYGEGLKIVGAKGDDWLGIGTSLLLSGKSANIVVPDYGAPVFITQQKK